MEYTSRISDATHSIFEGHLNRYLHGNGNERTLAVKSMIAMVARHDYHPRTQIPYELEEQFSRVSEGQASPTHALEALVGGEAIGRLNLAEGRIGRSI